MSIQDADAESERDAVPEYSLVTFIKRTPSGSSEPHIVPLRDVDTIEKLLELSNRIFDTAIPPRIFTQNNCPIPYICWPDTLRSRQSFYLETYELQYTRGGAPFFSSSSSSVPTDPSVPQVRPVIMVDYPLGLFSVPPLPDDLIVERLDCGMSWATLEANVKVFLKRQFSPGAGFTLAFEDTEGRRFAGAETVGESGVRDGALVYCRVRVVEFEKVRWM